MARVESGISADRIEAIANQVLLWENSSHRHGITVVWTDALCQHGYKRDEECTDCEGGYGTDGHTFFRAKGPVLIAGVTDDGHSVAYIPARFLHRVQAWLGSQDAEKFLEKWEADELNSFLVC